MHVPEWHNDADWNATRTPQWYHYAHIAFDQQVVVRPVYPKHHAGAKVISNHQLFAISIADEAPVGATSRFICSAWSFPSPGRKNQPS